MLSIMYETVNSEDTAVTGHVYKTESTTLIGKTGTAQIASSSGGYQTGSYNNIRSFAGLFPYEDPEYIIYISVKKLKASSSALAKPVKSIVESIAKYKNLDQLVKEEDTTQIIDIKNYINEYTETAEADLSSTGLEVIKIGDGTRVIDQYPAKGSTAIKGSKIYILTNSKNILMPNMVGWTSNEVGSYCNLVGINYNISGYGRVEKQSIETGTRLESNMAIDFTLNRKEDDTIEGDDQSGETE